MDSKKMAKMNYPYLKTTITPIGEARPNLKGSINSGKHRNSQGEGRRTDYGNNEPGEGRDDGMHETAKVVWGRCAAGDGEEEKMHDQRWETEQQP